jgi:hypothetical protein
MLSPSIRSLTHSFLDIDSRDMARYNSFEHDNFYRSGYYAYDRKNSKNLNRETKKNKRDDVDERQKACADLGDEIIDVC